MIGESPLRLVLASASPRRRELLLAAGAAAFAVRPAGIDESVRPGEDPAAYVERLAREKAAAVDAAADEVVLAADTTVALDGVALGKPADATEAAAMLRALSGRTHLVHTGVAVRRAGDPAPATVPAGTVMVGTVAVGTVVTTAVTFDDLDEAAIAWYVGTGEPFDKAGGYAIQGSGAVLVQRVEGSVTNVIGLPLAETAALLRAAGLPLTALRQE